MIYFQYLDRCIYKEKKLFTVIRIYNHCNTYHINNSYHISEKKIRNFLDGFTLIQISYNIYRKKSASIDENKLIVMSNLSDVDAIVISLKRIKSNPLHEVGIRKANNLLVKIKIVKTRDQTSHQFLCNSSNQTGSSQSFAFLIQFIN